MPGEDGRLSTVERALPGCIMVNQKGERYLNEAAFLSCYWAGYGARHKEHGDGSPSWMIFDHKYRHTFPMGPLYPIVPDWMHKKGIRTILKKPTLLKLWQKKSI